ncbi:MAG TPA: hypothetical protein VF093_05235, partial [Solirubrobacterales bacterium]
SVLGGGTRPSYVLRKVLAPIGLGLLVAAVGCGEGEGVAEDATVSAYVDAPLCAGAERELLSHSGRVDSLNVKAVCLPSATEGKKLNLALLGANVRRATEDSTAVAYLEASDPRAARFTHPILETAEIPWIASSSGKAAMTQLLRAIERAGSSGSLRASLSDELE